MKPYLCVVAAVAGTGLGISFVTKTGVFNPNKSSSSSEVTRDSVTIDGKIVSTTSCTKRNHYLKDDNRTCAKCPQPKGGKTFAIFWASETDGCLKVRILPMSHHDCFGDIS
jgi:hypothetical protein